MASVIFTYDGWIAVSMIAGEVIAPERLMKRIIIAGMLTIVILYVGANLAYLYMMPIGILSQQKEAVARTVMESIAGPAGGTAIILAVMVSVFGALNGNCLARPRVAFAMARDGLTFSFLGNVHPRFATPWLAMLIQSAAAIGMVLVLREYRHAHHLLRRRRVGRAHLRCRGGVRAAAEDGRCATAVSHARISMGANLLRAGDGDRRDGNRVGGNPGAQLFTDLRIVHCGGRVSCPSCVETMALVVLLRGVNVGGHRTFRPTAMARTLGFDAVSIGAAGTFVIRKPVTRMKIRAEFSRRLPFDADVMICDGSEILRLASGDPFAGQPSGPKVLQFAGVMAKRQHLPKVPLTMPPAGAWSLRIVSVHDRIILGVCRRK